MIKMEAFRMVATVYGEKMSKAWMGTARREGDMSWPTPLSNRSRAQGRAHLLR